jgi:hypothetical protein
MESESKKLSEIILEAIRAKNLTIEKLAQMTGISDRFLGLMVEEKFDELPPAPYLRGYLLKISDVLNIDGQQLWREYLKYRESMKRSGSKDILPSNRFENPKLNKKIIFAVIVLLPLTYFAVQIPKLIGRPQLYLANFEDNMTVAESAFTIRGRIKPTDTLTINQEEVYLGENGEFAKTVNLSPGFNTFVFKVKRFLGKENIVTKQIYYEPAKTNGR